MTLILKRRMLDGSMAARESESYFIYMGQVICGELREVRGPPSEGWEWFTGGGIGGGGIHSRPRRLYDTREEAMAGFRANFAALGSK